MALSALRGCYTALVTPFTPDGSAIDWAAHEKLVEAQIEGGVSGLVPCGTTGETPTLTDAEHLEMVRRTVRVAGGRVQVIAGTGTSSTKKTIEVSTLALEAGADAVMIVMPYYSRPSEEGLVRHAEAVASAVEGSVVLYDVPARAGVALGLPALGRILSSRKNVVGLKDASANVLQCQEICRTHDRFSVLSGDDALTVPMMSVGAAGVISVTSNLYPKELSAVVDKMLHGDVAGARAAHFRLLPVHHALFLEPSPAPVKAALALRGRLDAAVRLPMVPVGDETLARIRRAMDAFEARA
jgi:4-hydroxy-tetrahydrodipicolinate synthase